MRKATAVLVGSGLLAVLAGCATPGSGPAVPLAEASCAALAGKRIEASQIGISSGAAIIDTAVLVPASGVAVAERGPNPAAAITPALPQHCRVLGRIAGLDARAPFIHFQVNLPVQWNGRSVQYGGGGFNGVLITGTALVPAARYDEPVPLARGYVTYGTDSGHQNKPGEPPQAFAANEEALINFAHASYKKVRDVAVAVMKQAYGKGPEKLYFVGSSEGGREGLTMAQRYPADFDGILSRVPVIGFTGLQHAGVRDGLALMGDAYIKPAHVKLVHDAVLAFCDGADGLTDSIVSDPVGCKARVNLQRLRCTGAAADSCLTDPQIRAIETLQSPMDFGFEVANGLRQYPGRGPGGENTAAFASMGGWQAWWSGTTAPALPPAQGNGIAWTFGAGTIQHLIARNPSLDVRQYRAADHMARVREISALMDSTDPDLSAFQARGGKLIVLENMADYAQSPYMGIAYHQAVVQRLGRGTVDGFFKLYTAPGVDHVGTGAPGNAELFPALVAWVEQGRAPSGLTLVEQEAKAPFSVTRARPLCEWPAWPRYRGGDPNAAASFTCTQ